MKSYKKKTKAVEVMAYDEVLSYGRNSCKSNKDDFPLEFNIEGYIFNILPNGSYAVSKDDESLVLSKDAVILFNDEGIDVMNKTIFDKEYISLDIDNNQEEKRKPIAKNNLCFHWFWKDNLYRNMVTVFR